MSLKDFNPGWLNFGAIVVGAMISAAVSQAVSDSRISRLEREVQANHEYQRTWNAKTDDRISVDKLETRETLVGLKKDVESIQKGVASIQQVLMVRPTPTSLTSQHTP